MKRGIIAALAVATALAAGAACASSGRGPHTQYTYHSVFSNQPAPASTAPAAPAPASADMAPGPWPSRPGCNLNLYPEGSGIFQPDVLTVQPRWDVRCTVKVAVFLLTVRVQRWNGRAWDDELPIYTQVTPPTPYVVDDSPEDLTTACYPGKWRLEISWSGADVTGTHFGWERATQEVQLTCM